MTKKKDKIIRRNRIMSMIGKKIEEFKAHAYHTSKGEFIEVSEQDLQNQWSIVIFYPADFTFVCPTELEDLQKQYAKLQELGVEVYSVSTDTHFTHKAWHDHSDAISSLEYRSEEHTSELQSRGHLVCRLLLEKK